MLSCQTCQAKYTIANDKVVGKIVRIRCKKCGAIVLATRVPADGTGGQVCAAPPVPAVPTMPPRPGQRNEQSVLFSLAALEGARGIEQCVRSALPPPAGSTSEPSGLIDIRMLSRATPAPDRRPAPSEAIAHLGLGGVLTAQVLGGEPMLPQAIATPTREASGRPTVWPIVLGALAVGLAVTVSLEVSRTRGASPPTPSTAVAAGLPRMTVLQAATSSEAPYTERTSRPDAPPAKSAQSVHTSKPISTSTPLSAPPRPSLATSRPTETTNRCCPGEAEAACEMRRSVGAACAAPGTNISGPFDSTAAARALGALDLRFCGKAGGPTGAGHARVTFQPDGTVSEVVVDTPGLQGTATERCVAQAYRRAKFGSFSGTPVTVGKRFEISGE